MADHPKKRTGVACNGCRNSKIRCDGVRPSCQRCTKGNKECVYEKKTRSTRPSSQNGGPQSAVSMTSFASLSPPSLTFPKEPPRMGTVKNVQAWQDNKMDLTLSHPACLPHFLGVPSAVLDTTIEEFAVPLKMPPPGPVRQDDEIGRQVLRSLHLSLEDPALAHPFALQIQTVMRERQGAQETCVEMYTARQAMEDAFDALGIPLKFEMPTAPRFDVVTYVRAMIFRLFVTTAQEERQVDEQDSHDGNLNQAEDNACKTMAMRCESYLARCAPAAAWASTPAQIALCWYTYSIPKMYLPFALDGDPNVAIKAREAGCEQVRGSPELSWIWRLTGQSLRHHRQLTEILHPLALTDQAAIGPLELADQVRESDQIGLQGQAELDEIADAASDQPLVQEFCRMEEMHERCLRVFHVRTRHQNSTQELVNTLKDLSRKEWPVLSETCPPLFCEAFNYFVAEESETHDQLTAHFDADGGSGMVPSQMFWRILCRMMRRQRQEPEAVADTSQAWSVHERLEAETPLSLLTTNNTCKKASVQVRVTIVAGRVLDRQRVHPRQPLSRLAPSSRRKWKA